MTQAQQESVSFYRASHEQPSAWVESYKPEGASDTSHEQDQSPPLVHSVLLQVFGEAPVFVSDGGG